MAVRAETWRPGVNTPFSDTSIGNRAIKIVELIFSLGRHQEQQLPSEPAPEYAQIASIETFHPVDLETVLSYAYGSVDFRSKDKPYWKGKWDYRSPDLAEREHWSEQTKLAYSQLRTIVKWSCDPETRGHLDPAPGIPIYNDEGVVVTNKIPSLNNPHEVDEAVADLARYYYNFGEPKKIAPLLAVNKDGKFLAVRTIRGRGAPYVPEGERIASLERLIVNPEFRHVGIGTAFTAISLEYAFEKGYNGRGAEEIRVWIMQDRTAGDWQKNWDFFRRFGFRVVRTAPHWPEFARTRGFQARGDATWFHLKPEWYEERQKGDPRIMRAHEFAHRMFSEGRVRLAA